jgi:hypothetical protein
MSEDPPPAGIFNEVTTTNPAARQEGRVDAIFQYPEYTETVE